MQWYLLPVKHQKDVKCLLHWFQNASVLTVGPFLDLNFETVSIVSVF